MPDYRAQTSDKGKFQSFKCQTKVKAQITNRNSLDIWTLDFNCNLDFGIWICLGISHSLLSSPLRSALVDRAIIMMIGSISAGTSPAPAELMQARG